MKLNFVQKSRSYYKNNFCQLLPSTPYQTFLSLPKCFTTEQSTVEASFLLYDKESNNFPYLDADKRYFRRKFTSSVEEPTYSYRSTSSSNSVPLIGRKNIFLANQRGGPTGWLCRLLTPSAFLLRIVVQPENSRGEFQKKRWNERWIYYYTQHNV